MNTLHFKYALEIEKTGSITQAAENLYMAQPNLSRAIKELEESLGIEIFGRTSKGVAPTKEGREFLEYARIIVDQLEKMENISVPKDTGLQTLNVSIPRSSYISKAAVQFASMLDTNRPIQLNIRETSSMKTIENVIEGNSSLGIIRYQPAYESYFNEYLTEKGLSRDTVWESEYLVLMSRSHPLANEVRITRDELLQYTEVIYGDGIVPYLSMSAGRREDGDSAGTKKIYVYERGGRFDLIAGVDETYMKVSPLPEEMLDKYGLVQRKCDIPDRGFKDLLIYKKGYKFTEFDRKFIDQVYNCRNEVAYKDYN